MKYFTQDFKNKLSVIISEIESNSKVEIVVIIKPFSETYSDIALWFGAVLAFLIFSFFIFSPFVFGDYLIYAGTFMSFLLGIVTALFFKPLLRLLIPQKRMKRSVEIMARALFQKAGICHTIEKIGILFYFSLLEKKVFILADRGAENALHLDDWNKINSDFQNVFAFHNPGDALLKELKNCLPVFNKYLPPVENDINELPDNLDISL